jgi:hypothetical protein
LHAGNKFLQAAKGAENTKEKSRQCFTFLGFFNFTNKTTSGAGFMKVFRISEPPIPVL